MSDETLAVEIDETPEPFPRCTMPRKDGSRCNGAVGRLLNGDLDSICHGDRKKLRRQEIIAELKSRSGEEFDPAEVLYAADTGELASASDADLAYTLALIS